MNAQAVTAMMDDMLFYFKAVGNLVNPECSLETIYEAVKNRREPHPASRLPLNPKVLVDFISSYEKDSASETTGSLAAYTREYMIAEFQLSGLLERQNLERVLDMNEFEKRQFEKRLKK
jgi:hypothetical protein